MYENDGPSGKSFQAGRADESRETPDSELSPYELDQRYGDDIWNIRPIAALYSKKRADEWRSVGGPRHTAKGSALDDALAIALGHFTKGTPEYEDVETRIRQLYEKQEDNDLPSESLGGSQTLESTIARFTRYESQIRELVDLYCDPRLHNCLIEENRLFYDDPETGERRELAMISGRMAGVGTGSGGSRVVFEGPTEDTVIKFVTPCQDPRFLDTFVKLSVYTRGHF